MHLLHFLQCLLSLLMLQQHIMQIRSFLENCSVNFSFCLMNFSRLSSSCFSSKSDGSIYVLIKLSTITTIDNIIKNEENIHISSLLEDNTLFNKGIVITENIIACTINNSHVMICCHGNGGENPFILKLL